MSTLLVNMLIFIVFREMQETEGQNCQGYDSQNVRCEELTLQHGQICYNWHYLIFFWLGSEATFTCERQYELRPPNQQVKCQRDCFGCDPYWDGSPPICQKHASTTDIRSTASFLEPTTSRKNEKLDLKTNHPAQLTTGLPVYQNYSITTIKTATIPDEKQYLIAVYVTVPIVAVICLIALLLLAMRFRRKQQKKGKHFVSLNENRSVRNGIPDRTVTNKAYDVDVNSATIVGLPLKDEHAYGLYENSLVNAASVNVNHEITADKSRTADEADYESTSTVKENNMFHQEAPYSKINGCSVNSPEIDKEYDHLSVRFHAVTDSTYSHTSQTDDIDTYSHTNASDSRSVDKTYNTALSIAE